MGIVREMTDNLDRAAAVNGGAGMQNFRDVGGIATSDGGRIRAGVLYRSDAPLAGDPAPTCVAWPPATVIDLRTAEEAADVHPLTPSVGEVHAMALLARASTVRVGGEPEAPRPPLEYLYRQGIARAGRPLAAIAGIVARSDGPTLLHCTLGKDRTGLVVAAILSAVGAADAEVVADYVLSEANVPRVLARLSSSPELDGGASLVDRMARANPYVLAAPPGAITAALGALHEQGGAGDWLGRHGLSDAELSLLRERLVEGAG